MTSDLARTAAAALATIALAAICRPRCITCAAHLKRYENGRCTHCLQITALRGTHR